MLPPPRVTLQARRRHVDDAAAPPAIDEPAAAPLPPPTPDPADPYQMRASAVGLHPDLSRVLLTRLSPTDYRNAGIRHSDRSSENTR